MANDTPPEAALDVDAVPLVAFALADEWPPLGSEVHTHAKHQLLFCGRGSLRLIVDDAAWLLPPQRGAWIGAGVPHSVEATAPVALRTVYFAPDAPGVPAARCAVFAVDDHARAMLLHAMRWGPAHAPTDLSRAYFAALGHLCAEWVAAARPWHLPVARTPEVAAAMRHTLAHLADATAESAAEAAGVSTRTLARRFTAETGASWRSFQHGARMLEAMERLALPDTPVIEVALALGFDSASAFTHAFKRFAGVTPSAWRAASAA